MNVTVLGATGRTGRLLVAELRRRGHQVTAVVRDPSRAPEGARVVVGDSRDPQVLATALAGADAVVSALGPSGKEPDLHRRTVAQLVPAMRSAGVRRYIGISGAGTDAPGDRKRARDRVISRAMHLLARSMVADKAGELAARGSARPAATSPGVSRARAGDTPACRRAQPTCTPRQKAIRPAIRAASGFGSA